MATAGVPALLGPPTSAPEQTLMAADSPAIQPTSRIPSWGIYDGSKLAIAADSIVKLEYKASSRISNAPQEEGGFQSYNLVQEPYQARVTMTKGGDESARAAFLNSLEAAKQALTLYSVVMPETQFLNAKLVAYSYSRTARNGITLLTIEVILQEVRQASAPTFTTTTGGGSTPSATSPIKAPKKATGADPVNAGTQQAVTPTKAQSDPVVKAIQDSTPLLYDSSAAG